MANILYILKIKPIKVFLCVSYSLLFYLTLNKSKKTLSPKYIIILSESLSKICKRFDPPRGVFLWYLHLKVLYKKNLVLKRDFFLYKMKRITYCGGTALLLEKVPM